MKVAKIAKVREKLSDGTQEFEDVDEALDKVVDELVEGLMDEEFEDEVSENINEKEILPDDTEGVLEDSTRRYIV